MMDFEKFQHFLLRLRDQCKARLGGSYARGTEHFYSDIDLIIPNSTDRMSYVKKAIDIFNEFEVPWESAVIGSISSPRNLECLPKPVEVIAQMWIDDKRSRTKQSVEVFGVLFQKY